MAESRSLGYSDPRWKELRETVLASAGYRCECCGDEEKRLHAHHMFYLAGHKLWEYDDHYLCCLCEDCHNDWHNANDDLRRSMSWMKDPRHIRNMMKLQFAYRAFAKRWDERETSFFDIKDMLDYLHNSRNLPEDVRHVGSIFISEDEPISKDRDDDE